MQAEAAIYIRHLLHMRNKRFLYLGANFSKLNDVKYAVNAELYRRLQGIIPKQQKCYLIKSASNNIWFSIDSFIHSTSAWLSKARLGLVAFLGGNRAMLVYGLVIENLGNIPTRNAWSQATSFHHFFKAPSFKCPVQWHKLVNHHCDRSVRDTKTP